MIKKLMALIAFLGLLFGALSATTSVAQADPIKNKDGLCLVTPEKTTTANHDAEYVTESRWQREVPGVDEVSHMEYRFYKDIPAVDETFTTWYRWKLVEPTTVKEYRYKKIVPAVDGVQECQYKKWVKDYTTEYKYAKYVQTKTRTSEVWANFSPKNKHEPYVGPPSWPTDPDGKWKVHKDIPPGHSGDNGVYQKGEGNSSWFYRHDAGDWSDFGPWTLWSPLSHVSWKTFDQPSIGEPALHADGSNDGTDWYRQWQVRNTGDTRQVENGGHWEYQWFTEDPGEGWTKTDECRWKVEPVTEQTVWFPSEDSWTTEIKGDPWIKTDERTVPGDDSVTWFPSEDGWTKEVKESPWIKVAEEARSNEDGIPGYRLYLTSDEPSKDIDDAVWLLTDSVEGWTVLDSKKVVTKDAIPGYTEYYVHDVAPTRELGETNWTTDKPEGWVFVDTRETLARDAWVEEIVTDAKYEPCEEVDVLAFTGGGDMTGVYLATGLFALLAGGLLAFGAFRKRV